MENAHNGYFLKYFITSNLYQKILSTFKVESFKMLNNENDKKDVSGIPGFYGIMPIGLFSNPGFILNCDWLKTKRNFNIQMPNSKEIKSNINLTPAQLSIFKRIVKEQNIIIKENKAPVYLNLIAKCGTGKTILAIHLMTVLKLKCFVIAKSKELITQWANEITSMVSGLKIYLSVKGVSHLLKQDLSDYDVVLFPDKHLSNIEFIHYLRENFSMGFIDEQHTYNFETNFNFRRFLLISSFNYLFSLTATPRKGNEIYLGKDVITQDIVEKLQPLTFIPRAIEINRNSTNDGDKTIQELKNYELTLKKNISKQRNQILHVQKLRLLSVDVKRINLILSMIIHSITIIKDPKIIVLVHFNDEINIYYEELKKNQIDVYPVYANKNEITKVAFEFKEIKNALLKKERFIIIGTEANLGTGMDLKTLNILHLTSLNSNLKNLEQYFGRISRNNESKEHFTFYYNFTSYKILSFQKELTNIKNIIKKMKWREEIKFV